MRSGKWYFLHTVVLSAVIAGFAGTGCRKENGIVNNKVIRTPYSLYFADRLGGLYNTNDGQAYNIIFPKDGVPGRSLLAAGGNILWAKYNLHLSADNGRNFNPVNTSVLPAAQWHSLMLNGYSKTFLASTFGILESNNNGQTWEPSPIDPVLGGSPVVHSFARVSNGQMYSVDATGNIYEKPSQPAGWRQVTINAGFPSGTYHLGNYNNALLAGDASGASGVWYSNNGGQNWAQYPGLPTNQEIRSIVSPFGQTLLVGMDSIGVYRLSGDTLRPSNNGLTPFTTVYGIVGKQDVYKNEEIRQYVYIATSTGLYRSEDLGLNWALMRGGEYRTIY
jgi:hypothetical protein